MRHNGTFPSCDFRIQSIFQLSLEAALSSTCELSTAHLRAKTSNPIELIRLVPTKWNESVYSGEVRDGAIAARAS
jgi:hypothetical protein